MHQTIGGQPPLFSFSLSRFYSKKQLDGKALVALTLLIAASDPRQKKVLIRLIDNLLMLSALQAETGLVETD